MQTNLARAPVHTHEGGKARHINPELQLRRSVLACLLFENQFYEDGQEIAERIQSLVSEVYPDIVAALAVEARHSMSLRHVPLLLLACLANRGALKSDAVEKVISRPDEMGELLAIHCAMNGVGTDKIKAVLPNQMKLGIAGAFTKFDAYQLAKWNRPKAIKLRDVMFLTHPNPKNKDQSEAFKRLADDTLSPPDTWEVALSGGADKRETFTRLIRDGKLGYMALLRNLRNMVDSGVDSELMRQAIIARKGARYLLPFRYVAAARACPQMEPALDRALIASIEEQRPLTGKTLILVDVSGSMFDRLSSKSELTRVDAAATLASMVSGDIRVFTFSSRGAVRNFWSITHDGKTPVCVEVPPRRGMSGVDAIIKSQENSGTFLGQAVKEVNAIRHDRLIVLTDEQSHDPVPDPVSKKAYMVNVASNKNGVGYGKWIHIDGWSDSVIRYIMELEGEANPHTLDR